MPRILLVEDCRETAILVRGVVGRTHEIDVAVSAAEARARLGTTAFDLVILDVMLPDGDGYHLCSWIRQNEQTRSSSNVPIIFLSGKGEVSDKVLGLSLGADDYVVKPFEPMELRARIESKLNAGVRGRGGADVFRKGAIEFNLLFQKATLQAGGQTRDLNLTPNEFRLLCYLAKNEGQVFSRERLLETIWGKTHVLDRTVDAHVYSLRRKLDDQAYCIESIHSEGYRFFSSNV
jgi:DNA-binding response OmpR family regulator